MDSVLEELRRTVMTAADGMTEEQLRWHPEGKWCAAEVLEHLYLSYTGTIKGLERVLGAGKTYHHPSEVEPADRNTYGFNFQLFARRQESAEADGTARARGGAGAITV